jgi:hypothetical protein
MTTANACPSFRSFSCVHWAPRGAGKHRVVREPGSLALPDTR